jgi:F-type H+-transporting ATPase subunit b
VSKIVFTLLVLSGMLFASEHAAEASTDIVQRTVNFLIFAGIIYYILAEPIKNYFGGRSQGIAIELEKVQEKLKESKLAKETAQQKVVEAEKFAESLIESTKKENKLLNGKIMQQCDLDLENVVKQNSILMQFEQRKMTSEMVEEVMKDILNENNLMLDDKAMSEIITKKVA